MAQQYMDKLNTLVITKNPVAVGFPSQIENDRRNIAKRIAELETEIALLEKSLTEEN